MTLRDKSESYGRCHFCGLEIESHERVIQSNNTTSKTRWRNCERPLARNSGASRRSFGFVTDQERRYLTDAGFHARVEVVSRALWDAVARFDLGHERPYPFDRLIPETQRDLMAYAIAAVEAIEALETPPQRGEVYRDKETGATFEVRSYDPRRAYVYGVRSDLGECSVFRPNFVLFYERVGLQ